MTNEELELSVDELWDAIRALEVKIAWLEKIVSEDNA